MLFDLADACGPQPGWVCESVYEATDSELWAGAARWLVNKPAKVAIILVVAWLLNRFVRRVIASFVDRTTARIDMDHAQRSAGHRGIGDGMAIRPDALTTQSERRKQRTETLGTVLCSLATAVIYSTAVLVGLGEFQINLGPLIAGAGVVGIAIGFGAQTVVRDFLSGIFMLIEDQYGSGDIIDFGDATGVVEAVSLRTTRVRDVEGTVWFVPNGEIKRIGNKSQLWSRAVMDIEVAYDTDLGTAATVIKEVADSVWGDQLESATIVEEPEIWGVQSFGASAIAIRLVIKTEPGEQFAAAREIRGRLKAAFDAAGIEIPFPQHSVWMRQQPTEGSPVSSVLHAQRPAADVPDLEA